MDDQSPHTVAQTKRGVAPPQPLREGPYTQNGQRNLMHGQLWSGMGKQKPLYDM